LRSNRMKIPARIRLTAIRRGSFIQREPLKGRAYDYSVNYKIRLK
jgi:hypothetical protein